MDVSTFHTLTEDLAAFLSEATQGDLRRPIPGTTGDLGDLYLRLIDQNVSTAAAITGETLEGDHRLNPSSRADLEFAVDDSGSCGLEAGYRRSLRFVENALIASESGEICATEGRADRADLARLVETLISDTVMHTWNLAQALGFSYTPASDDVASLLPARNRTGRRAWMRDLTLDSLLALEREGWDALCASVGGQFYGDLMTRDGTMVLVDGVALDRDAAVASLDQAPAWDSYELADVHIVPIAADVAALVYHATAHRGDGPPFEALMASTYVMVDGSARLALYQQTTAGVPVARGHR